MLNIKQGDTEAILILTLTELTTEKNPDYYFVFTHVTTKQTVILTLSDESEYPNRYNKFEINASVEFANKPIGEWHYKVFENDAEGVVLEQGKMMLTGSVDFAYDTYNSETSFKTYNG